MTMDVRDVMRTQVVSVSPDDSVADAALELIARGAESALVRNQDGEYIGLVSERDLLQSLLPAIADLMERDSLRGMTDLVEMRDSRSSIKVQDIMTRELSTISPDVTLVRALGTMLSQRHRRLPVVADGLVVGVLTQQDLLRRVFLAG
jgi:CBS domain-containing protein